MEFALFPHLPHEIQLLIWDLASPICYNRVIPFCIAEPDPHKKHLKMHHVSIAQRKEQPLLLACHDSRAAILKHQDTSLVLGFKTELIAFRLTARPEIVCEINLKSRDYAKSIFWNPNTDLVFMGPDVDFKPLFLCRKARCIALDVPFSSFRFDERLRFMAMPAERWELGYTCDTRFGLYAKGLQVIFLLVSEKTVYVLQDNLDEHINCPERRFFEGLLSAVLHFQGKPLDERDERARVDFYRSMHDSTRGLCCGLNNRNILFISSIEDAFKHIDKL